MLAKENDILLTQELAESYWKQLHTDGAISDDELDSVSGGSCHVTVKGDSHIVVSSHLKCMNGKWEVGFINTGFFGTITTERKFLNDDNHDLRKLWADCSGDHKCGSCLHLGFKGAMGYCKLT